MRDDGVLRHWLAQADGMDVLSRRRFLELVGAAAALAGLDGCTRMPAEHILPFVHQPPEQTPGVAQHYATSMVLDGFATGLVVESHEGRPTKVEGNPEHPASLGATGAMEQASVLQLYDPDRARWLTNLGRRAEWTQLTAMLAPARLRQRVGVRGAGLRLLVEPTSSPLEITLLQAVEAEYPEAVVHVYAPLASTGAGTPLAGALPQYDLAGADVVLSLGADVLASGPFHLRYAHDFASRRRLRGAAGDMNRLYVVESMFTPTGAAADHRLAVRPSELEDVARALLVAVRGGTPGDGDQGRWIAAVARDLVRHRGRSVVVVAPEAAAQLAATAAAINDTLGATGTTTWSTPSPLFGAGETRRTLPLLREALRAGGVDTLVVVGGNPAYASPGALEMAQAMRAAKQAVYLGPYANETARLCAWHVPQLHYLESWGDARAYDGTLSLVQPLVQPLREGWTAAELLATMVGRDGVNAHAMLREAWQRTGGGTGAGGADLEERWREALQRGVVPGTTSPRASAGSAVPHTSSDVSVASGVRATASAQAVDVLFAPDPRLHDGRFANNAWLQELPAPITTLAWDNAVELAPATARRLGVETGDAVLLRRESRQIRVPALIAPGVAEDTAILRFGYGRDGAERLARGVGVNVYDLWDGAARNASGVSVTADHQAPRRALAVTQAHWSLEGRDPVRATTIGRYRTDAGAQQQRSRRSLTLYEPPAVPNQEGNGMQWAMTIDLGLCTGCSACVVACQAENNIPTVGREGVLVRREMHWLRIDRYVAASPEQPRIALQPMLCQHCEKAPCEYVCPVEATVHSADGLNEMVYNRCVGTRFCSNNCPYKVRRFNWFDYNGEIAETVAMVKNPDVTVRERGVMEKCTFCVQRIREAEIAAGVDGRPLKGGDVRTACQQACPTQAIVFGSLTEQDSEVVRLRDDPRSYAVLDELGTEPRVRYLAAVRNTNPELPNDL